MANEIKVEINKVKNINVSIQKIEGIGGGTTNLTYTASPTNGTVNSDTGTDATIPLADVTNAGLITPAEKAKLTNTSGTNTGDNATNSQYSALAADKANLSGATFTGKVTVENEIEIKNPAIAGNNNGIIQKVDNVGGKGVFRWLFNNTSGFPLVMSAVRNVANTLDFVEFAGRVKIQDGINADEAISVGQANASLALKADISGQVFTGAISATNLSGTNTGDETSSTIISKLGFTPNYTIFKQNTQALASGTTETTLATFTLPGGTLGINSGVRINAILSMTSSADAKNIKVNFGSSTIINQTFTTNTGIRITHAISNAGTLTNQVTFGNTLVFATTTIGTPVVRITENTNNDLIINITGEKANAGDTLALEQFFIEILP